MIKKLAILVCLLAGSVGICLGAGTSENVLFNGENYVIAKKLLDESALRHAALASNIANVETPGYKRVDIDKNFEVQLNEAAGKSDLKALKALRPRIVQDPTAAAVRPDGNTVSLEKEMALDGANEMQYEFTAQYLANNLQMIQASMK